MVVLLLSLAACLGGMTPDEIRTANDFLGPVVTRPDGRAANASAHYWTDVVGVAFDRDAEIVVPPTPLDLDLDGHVDTTFEGRWSLPGGLLANPEMAGFIATPDDPRGTRGRWSISTGFLGVREEMDPETHQGTGRYGLNCWYCHAGRDHRGEVVLGLPNRDIHLGLIMSSSSALDAEHVISEAPGGRAIGPDELRRREALDESFHFDTDGDGRVTIREWRSVLRLPSAEETKALLMLAGPGRLDQSVDYRMDGTIPLASLQHYTRQSQGEQEYLRNAKKLKRAAFNPVSIPQNLTGLGAAHYSWTGKESSMRHDAVALATSKMGNKYEDLARILRIPLDPAEPDYEALSRLLTLDFRNVGTAGRESDFTPGNAWAYHVMTDPTESLLTQLPAMYGAVELRGILTRSRPGRDTSADPLVEEGRRIFTDVVVGEVINQRVIQGRETHVPEAYKGIAVMAPLDRSRPLAAKVPVRCSTCHTYSPLSAMKPIENPLASMQRCDLCHLDHHDPAEPDVYLPLGEHMKREQLDTVEGCLRCHERHPNFGPLAWTNSWLLPFDADGDGQTHGDELDDAAAGGIGTDAHLNLDSLFTVQLRPLSARPAKMYLNAGDAHRAPTNPTFSRQGYGWVRVAPLIGLADSAPYLHNGSVPTLNDLLTDPAHRPQTFAVGRSVQHFTFDTRLPGNGNQGHDYGTRLTAEQKRALVRFLESLP